MSKLKQTKIPIKVTEAGEQETPLESPSPSILDENEVKSKEQKKPEEIVQQVARKFHKFL